MNHLTLEALAERVRVLESSICRCGDCVMHRDKARHGKASTKGACMTHVPSEEVPAWKRAKVGDRVQHKKWGECLVENLRDRSGSHVQLIPRNDWGSRQTYWSLDDSILSILPPEPAAQPNSRSERTLPPKHARFAAAALREWVGAARETWPEDPPGDWDWNDIGLIDGAISFLCAIGTPGPHSEPAALVQDGPVCQPPPFATQPKGIRFLAENGAGEWFYVNHANTWQGCPCPLPAVSLHPLSIDWNTALDTFYGTRSEPFGTASDGLLAVLRLIPGLKIVEG